VRISWEFLGEHGVKENQFYLAIVKSFDEDPMDRIPREQILRNMEGKHELFDVTHKEYKEFLKLHKDLMETRAYASMIGMNHRVL